MGMRWLGIALVLALSLAACGDPPTDRSVTETSAAQAVYDGDLAGKGAAELALECVGATFRRGVGDPEGGLEENGETPALGLDHWLDPEGWLQQVPRSGYAIEREDGDRALISYDDRDRTVIAFVMHDGQKDYYDDDVGWVVESPDRDLRASLRTTYALDVPVPDDARDTGYQRGGSRLLVAADGSAAYLVPAYQGADRSVGDRWPAEKKQIGCI